MTQSHSGIQFDGALKLPAGFGVHPRLEERCTEKLVKR